MDRVNSVQIEIQVEHVHAGFAEEAELAAFGVLLDQRAHVLLAHAAFLRHAREPETPPRQEKCPDRGPSPEVVTRSAGMGAFGFVGCSDLTLAFTRSISILFVGPRFDPPDAVGS